MRGELTKIQIMERKRRKRERVKMRGMPTPKGTPPAQYIPVATPWFKPWWGAPAVEALGGFSWRSLWSWIPRVLQQLIGGVGSTIHFTAARRELKKPPIDMAPRVQAEKLLSSKRHSNFTMRGH